MDKQPKRPRDPNQLAKLMIDIASDEGPPPVVADKPLSPAERGRLGGQKGGKTRIASLSADERIALAKKAASARWNQ